MHTQGEDDVHRRILTDVYLQLYLRQDGQHIPIGIVQSVHGIPAHGADDGQPVHSHQICGACGSNRENYPRQRTRYRRRLGQAGYRTKRRAACHLSVFHGTGTVGYIAHRMAHLRIRMAIRLLLHDGTVAALHPYFVCHDALS